MIMKEMGFDSTKNISRQNYAIHRTSVGGTKDLDENSSHSDFWCDIISIN